MRRAVVLCHVLVLGVTLVVLANPLLRTQAQEATPDATCPTTTVDENKVTARRWHEEALNQAKPEVLDEFVAPDIVHHSGTLPDGEGLDFVKMIHEIALGAFPDAEYSVEDVIAEGDFVVLRWQAEGTHEGELQGYPATGKRVTWTGINIFRFECGKIAESWVEVDGLGRLRQLGLVATPTP